MFIRCCIISQTICILLTFLANNIDLFFQLVPDEMGIYAYDVLCKAMLLFSVQMVRINGESDAAEIPENGCMVEDGFNPRVESREKVERTGDERFIIERWCHFGIWFDFFPRLSSFSTPTISRCTPPTQRLPSFPAHHRRHGEIY